MFITTFTDGSTFQGGNPQDSKWDQMPNLPIKEIEYSLTPFIKYVFKDFDGYNHCVERVRGVNTSFERITRVIIMGRTENRVYQIMLDQDGSVYQLVVPVGKEYSVESKLQNGKFAGWSNAKPLTGWKKGIELGPDQSPRLEKIMVKA